MNVEYIQYRVDPARADAFVAAFRQALSLLERAPEVLGFDLVRDSDDPARFVVRIDWASRDSQKAYLGTADYKSFMSFVSDFNDAFVSMQFHDPIVSVSKRVGAP